MKATAVAPTNVALVKYWGKQRTGERLPSNANLSLTVDNMLTTSTIEFSDEYTDDTFELYGQQITDVEEVEKLSTHLDRLRSLGGKKTHAKLVSTGNVPPSCGFSSSASGFAALTLAAVTALGAVVSEPALSVLARRGSGSACRSIPSAGGLVEWHYGQTSEESYAETVAQPDTWPDLCIVAAVVSRDKKYLPTTTGMAGAQTSPFFSERLRHIDQKILAIKSAYAEKDFTKLGEITEKEAIELHAIMMTQAEPCLYLHPNTLALMQTCQRDWRSKQGLEVYFTVNTGQNPWLLVRQQDLSMLQEQLAALPYVEQSIVNHGGVGARLTDKHLF